MLKFLSKILSLFFLFSFSVYSQDISAPAKEDEKNTSRLRILLGYSTLVAEGSDLGYGNIFINANYRVNNFDPDAKPLSFKWSFEGGLNVVKMTHSRATGVGVVPYLKTGPVINAAKNLSVGGSLGMVISLYGGSALFPYFGANAYYSLPLEEKLSLELETGGHSSFFFSKPHSLVYFTAGIGLK